MSSQEKNPKNLFMSFLAVPICTLQDIKREGAWMLVQSKTLLAFCKWISVRACLQAIISGFCWKVLLLQCMFWACLINVCPFRASWKQELLLLPLPQPPLLQAKVCPPAWGLEHMVLDSLPVTGLTPAQIPSCRGGMAGEVLFTTKRRWKGHWINKVGGKMSVIL